MDNKDSNEYLGTEHFQQANQSDKVVEEFGAELLTETGNIVTASEINLDSEKNINKEYSKTGTGSKKLVLIAAVIAAVILIVILLLIIPKLKSNHKNAIIDSTATEDDVAEITAIIDDEGNVLPADIVTLNNGDDIQINTEKNVVPLCIGQTEDEAVSLLESSGITYEIFYADCEESQNGLIINQNIDEGVSVPENAVLNITVGRFKNSDVIEEKTDDTVSLIEISAVSFEPSSFFMELGSTETFSTAYSPANADITDYYYDISDYDVIYLDQDNIIYAVGTGSAIITAKTPEGKVLGNCKVSVYYIEPETTTLKVDTKPRSLTSTTTTTTTSPKKQAESVYYTVTFDAMGGKLSNTSVRVKSGNVASLPSPIKDGYSFNGWYTDSSGGTKFSSSHPITSNITLYARWSKNPESDWVETAPANSIITARKTQYRYRDKITTTSTDSNLSGWNQSGSKISYGNWSSWSPNAKTSSPTLQVETKTVFRYYYYKCSSCGERVPLYGNCKACGKAGAVPEDSKVNVWSTTAYNKCNSSVYKPYDYKRYTTSVPEKSGKWYFSAGNLNQTAVGTVDAAGTKVIIQKGYRSRSINTTYTYWKWSDFSQWSDNPVSETESRKVETRELIKYILK